MSDVVGVQLGIEGLSGAVKVGQGSYGVVYRASQEAYGRTVAVKILTSPLVDDDSRRRFQRECRALGSLSSHPNIVTLHAAGTTEDDRPYLIMDYLPGGSLAARVASAPLEWQEVTGIGVKLAGALAAAHEQGILHRDIKPENILISAYGEPQLADFGVAKIQGGTSTSTGTITGSLAHASPEVISGVQATVASDMWSLASTLSTLVAGHPPFYRPDDESLTPLITRILTKPPQDLRPLGVPDLLCAFLETGLKKDSWERPQTALDFGHSLQDVQRALGLTITVMPAVGGLRTVNPSQPSVRSTAPSEADRPETEDPLDSEARPGAEPAPTPETATRRRGSTGPLPVPATSTPTPPADDNRRRSLFRRSQADATDPIAVVPSDTASYSSASSASSAASATPTAPTVERTTPDPATRPSTEPDSSQIGPPRNRGASRSWLVGGAVVVLAVLVIIGVVLVLGHHGKASPAAGRLQWSVATDGPIASVRGPAVADGSVIFASQDHFVRAVDEVKGTLRWKVNTAAGFSSPVVDNHVVYVGGEDGKVHALALADGHELWSFSTGGKIDSSPAVEGTTVYVSSEDGNLYALDAGTGQKHWSATVGAPTFSSPAIANDILVVGSANGDVVALNTTDGSVRWRAKTGGSVYSSPAIAGGSVYVGSNDHQIYALRLQDGGQLWSFPTNDVVSSSPAISAGELFVGSFDHNVYSVLANTGGERWRFSTGANVFSSPKVDDGIVYIGSHDDMLHAIDSTSGKEIWNFKAQAIVGATPTVADGIVFVGSDDGHLYALATGRKSK